MPWGAAIVAGGAIVGSEISSSGAKDAANAQAAGAQAGINEQQHEFDTLLSLSAPQRSIGNQALATLGGIYGYTVPTDATQGNQFALPQAGPGVNGFQSLRMAGGVRIPTPIMIAPTGSQMTAQANNMAPMAQKLSPANYQNFFASPDYQFRLNQGMNAVQNSAAAQGGLYSGNSLRALSDYGQGTAAGEFGNWFNRQALLAGIGQSATQQAGQGALATGANIGNLLVNQGNARASGIIDQTNSTTNTINQLAQLLGSKFGAGSSGSLDSGWGSGANLDNAWAGQWGGVSDLNLG